MADDESEDSDISPEPVLEAPQPVDAIVEQARGYAKFALQELLNVARGRGGRGATARTTAARAILELGRYIGADSEDYVPKKRTLASVPNLSDPVALEAARQELIRRRQQASGQ